LINTRVPELSVESIERYTWATPEETPEDEAFQSDTVKVTQPFESMSNELEATPPTKACACVGALLMSLDTLNPQIIVGSAVCPLSIGVTLVATPSTWSPSGLSGKLGPVIGPG
jgi:hypothetical protein